MKVREIIGLDARVTTRSRPDFRPDITIVTPTYRRNAENLLLKCLHSALNQTFTSFEHIIVDDGSSDGTEEVVLDLCERDERVVYVRHDRNSGLPAVRTNEGILRARGRAVAFLFDDNVFKPSYLADALRLLDESDADVVYGEVEIPMAGGNTVVFGGAPVTLDLLRNFNTIANGGVLIRRDFFDRFGLYDPHLAVRRVCDWELWVRSLWLGARFRHLPQVVAEEGGHVSETSLGNTVALDWKVSLAYVQDSRAYADRARRLGPSAILDEDVLDPGQVTPYVRDANEWTEFVGSTYRPFLDRHGIDFDPLLLSNRAESVDPASGWNALWALHHRRFRALLLANAVPSLAAAFLDAMRAIPGAIVLNCPEWHLSSVEPGALDVIVSLDGGSPGVEPYLERHWAAGARLLTVSAYGNQQALDEMAFGAVPLNSDPVLKRLFGDPLPYFPEVGFPRPPALQESSRQQREVSDIVIEAGQAPHGARIGLPLLPEPGLSTRGRRHARRVAYRLTAPGDGDAEPVAWSRGEEADQVTGESLASFVISHPGTEIVVERRGLEALPRAELIGLGCLAAAHDVDVVPAGGEASSAAFSFERVSAAADWHAWFANLVRVLRLRDRLKVSPRDPLVVDIYLNSELFAGSEVYGLHIAKLLSELGIRTRVRLPERNIYGEPTAINDWLAEHGLPPALRAPYLPSVHHTMFRPFAERASAVARLRDFIRADPPHLIVASAHIPQLAEVPDCPPLFMAFFSAANYQQTWLRDLHGQVHGIMSDSEWALRPTAAVIGVPARVIPSATLGAGGGEIARVTADSRRNPVRIAVAGTIIARKRQLEAVKAVAALRRRGYDVELHLYGFELEIAKAYVALVDETIVSEGMADHIIRHGFVENSSEITRENDIVLCASTDESLPQGLVFQMYQGLVGVAVLCGGVDEIVLDGRTGYLTRDPNPAGLADALARALDDRPNWRCITEQARQHIWERCGSANVTADLLDLFEEGLALRQPGYLETDAKARAAEAGLAAILAGDGTGDVTRSGAARDAALLHAALGGGPADRARIAYFCHSPYLGGAENVILKLTSIAAAHAFDPILVLPLAWGGVRAEIVQYAEQAGVALHYLPLHIQTEVETERPLDLAAVEAIRTWLREHRVSFVHSVTFMWEVGEAARREGIPHVASLFATESTARAAVEHCDAIHSDTAFYAGRWEGVLGVPSRRILSSVPDPYFHVAAERPIPERVEAIRRRPVVGLFGTLQPRKGQLKSIEAVARLRHRQGLDVELHLYGYDHLFPDCLAECKDTAAKHGVEDLIHFHGFVEESTHHALRRVDIVLCASDWESLPQSILEGMAAGALIISPRIGGIAEILTEETGIVIPDNSPSWIARGIMRAVWAPPASLQAKMEAARAAAVAGCANDVVASSMFQLYVQAVSHRDAQRGDADVRRIAPARMVEQLHVAEVTSPNLSSRPESAPVPINLPPTSPDFPATGHTRITLRATGGRICGADLAVMAGRIVAAAVSSTVRPDLVLRRLEASADQDGVARLRWLAIEVSESHVFILHVDLADSDAARLNLLKRLRRRSAILQRIVYEESS